MFPSCLFRALCTPGAVVGAASDGGDAVHEFGAEDDVGVAEHALLQGHHYELGVGEVRLDHAADVLRVAQVQRSIHLHRHKMAHIRALNYT